LVAKSIAGCGAALERVGLQYHSLRQATIRFATPKVMRLAP